MRCFHTTPPPSILPEQLANGSCRVSRQSSSPVDPARAARQWIPPSTGRQWIPPSIPPERLASGSRPVSRQSGSLVDPAQSSAKAAGLDPAQYPARAARLRAARQWIPPGIPRVSRYPASIEPERLASGARQYPARAACQSGFA